MIIDSKSLIPLYAQVEAAISADISAGKWSVGDRLPPEETLIAQYQVSRTTLRTAIQNLVNRKVIEIRRGLGTFICEKKITQELTELTGFVEDMKALGLTATAKVLETKTVEADAHVAQALRLRLGESVTRIARVRIADGMPLSLDETYLPIEIGKKIVLDDLKNEPIFKLLEEKYGVPLISANYLLEAVVADESVASALKIAPGSAIFRIERTSLTTDGKPIDYERLHYRGDKIRFQTQLQRAPRKA